MQPIPFIAASAEEAVAQIRAKLGPEAVVLNVRRLPSNGLARLWQKPMIEVLACVPAAPAPEPEPISETLAEFRQQLLEIKQQVENRQVGDVDAPVAASGIPAYSFPEETEEPASQSNWHVGAILQSSGLQPLLAQRVLDQLRARYGDSPPASRSEEITLAQLALKKFWRQPSATVSRAPHVLVGPAGSGKTTSLCKWLTQAVLMEGRRAKVWRLDGAIANTAESLSVYCEILGVPSERSWPGDDETSDEEISFIDLPGVDYRNPLALKELAKQLKQFGSPRVHLVLNGAYDVPVLLAQIRAFAVLPIEDLIITHLDEETRWGKLWNLILGTNYSLRYLSTGQNIPGDFCAATPEMIFARQFRPEMKGFASPAAHGAKLATHLLNTVSTA